VADQLGITPENLDAARIDFVGREYDVVGILNEERFRAIRDIDGNMLVPLQIAQKARGQDDSKQSSDVSLHDIVPPQNVTVMPTVQRWS